MSYLFNTFLVTPLYNVLILLIDLPLVNLGGAVVLLTVLVKFALLPLSKKAIQTQEAMKVIQAPLKELQEKYKDDRQKLAAEMMQLYRDHGVNPFSSIFLILIQLPIIFALYWVFYKGGLPAVNLDILYGFVPVPEFVSTKFLGIFDIVATKNIWLAAITGVTYYIQAIITLPKPDTSTKFGESMKDDLMRSLHVQTKYVFPVIIFFIAFSLQAVISVYWITSNIFTIGQHVYLKRLADNSKA